MKIVRCLSDVKKIYSEILKRPHIQNEVGILGTLHSAIRGLWKLEVVVDNWPNFSALVSRPLQLEPRLGKFQEVYLYGELEPLRYLLLCETTLPWAESITFRECCVGMKPVLCDAAQKHGGSIVDPDRNYQYYQARNLQDYLKVNMFKLIPEGFKLGPLVENVLPNVQNVRHRDPRKSYSTVASAETQKILVRESYSSCLYNPDDKPVCWIFAHMSGETFDAYTDPHYRGRHLIVPTDMYIEHQAQKFGQPHSHKLVHTNNKSSRSALRIHYKALPQLITYFHYLPLDYREER